MLLIIGSCPWFLLKNYNKGVQIITIKNKFLQILHPSESVQTQVNKRVYQLYNCKEKTCEEKRKNCKFTNPTKFLSQFNTGDIHPVSDASGETASTQYSFTSTSENESSDVSMLDTPVLTENCDVPISSQITVSMSSPIEGNVSDSSITHPSQESMFQFSTQESLNKIPSQDSSIRFATKFSSISSTVSSSQTKSKMSQVSSGSSYYGQTGSNIEKYMAKKVKRRPHLFIPPKSDNPGLLHTLKLIYYISLHILSLV